MTYLKTVATTAACLVAIGAVDHAHAATLIVNLAGITSNAEEGDPANIVRTFNVGALSQITTIRWSFVLTAFTPSWLSEAAIGFGSSTGSEIVLTAGIGDDNPGTATYSGTGDLVDLGLDFTVGNDGLLVLEFFETFDDSGANPDSRYISGTLTIDYSPVVAPIVPEPATWAMMVAGFGLAGSALRYRRRRTAVTFG